MPKDKDLKRLVRARMSKTGEAYTAAREQIVRKTDREAAGEGELPDDYVTLAGMSDEAVRAKTGRSWPQWVRLLDHAGGPSMSHREIAEMVDGHGDFGGWWSQTVTVGYERIRGLRELGQRRSGSYEASKSKTMPASVDRLFEAFAVEAQRVRWLPDTSLTVRTATRDRSMRMLLEDGTTLEAYFTAKGAAKSAVSLQQRKLPSAEAREEAKAFWGERLTALAALLKER